MSTTAPKIPRSLPGSGKAGRLTSGHWVIIQAWADPLAVAARLGPDGDQPKPVTGKWDEIARPPRLDDWDKPGSAPISWFAGRGRRGKTLVIVLDGWTRRLVTVRVKQRGKKPVTRRVARRGRHVEGEIDILEQICERGLTVRLIGPLRHTDRRFVINSVSRGDSPAPIRHPKTGRLMRQAIVLDLDEYVPSAGLQRLRRSQGG